LFEGLDLVECADQRDPGDSVDDLLGMGFAANLIVHVRDGAIRSKSGQEDNGAAA